MLRDQVRKMSVVIAGGFLIAACGGSDDEPGSAADLLVDDGASDDGASDDDASDDDASDDDASDDGGAGEDAGSDDGSTGSDDVQQSLDDAGVDLDLDELAESIGNMSTGEGGGVVTIDGVDYTFDSTAVCIVQGDDFVAEGLGQDPDGNPAWVSISASQEDLDGDGTTGPAVDISVDPGRTELFGDGPDDAPDFSATYWEGFSDASQEVAYELGDGSITGSGPVQDFSGTVIPFGETAEMTFEASCN